MLIGFFVFLDVLSECLLALLASKDHFGCWLEFVIFSELVLVALWAVEPQLAAWSSDGNLGVKNVLAHI